MSLKRVASAVCSLVLVALSVDASAAPTASSHDVAVGDPSAASAASRGVRSLPHGVHRKRDGQYVRSICAEGASLRCLARQALPRSYVPGVSPIFPPRAESVTSTPGSGGMGPAEIAAAYNLSSLPAGTGNIVAIIDAPDFYAASDLAGYRAGYGLPALPTCPSNTNGGLPVAGGTPCFAAVDETGALFTASLSQDSQNGGDFETALDMDMISAACPACSILLVQLTGQTQGSGELVAAAQAASTLGAVAISISLGSPEATDPLVGGTTHDPTGFTTQGHLVFAAAGDFGYDEETLCGVQDAGCGAQTVTTPSYPASAPDVIAVGGTALFNANGAGVYTESVWDDGAANAQDVTTSGCSSEFDALSWQQTQTNLPSTNCKLRATADLSAAAAYATTTTPPSSLAQLLDSDIIIYTTSDPSSGIDGFGGGTEGTSAASPMVAAIFARIGLATIMTASLSSDSLGWPYFHQSAFNDVTVGTDDVDSISNAALDGFQFGPQCTGANLLLCNAGAGWDGPTGVGTPNGTKLLALVDPTAATMGGSAGGGGSGAVDASTGGSPSQSGGSTAATAVNAGAPGAPTTVTHEQASAGFPALNAAGCACATSGRSANGAGATGLLLGFAALAALVVRGSRRRRSR